MTTPASNSAPAVHLLRCNPFGHSTGPGGDRGPRHLLGGLYGPAYEGAMKWQCEQPADGWYRMTCQCDPPHRGQRMPLCYSHVAMIGKRMAGVCPPCVMPPQALALHGDIQRAGARVAWLIQSGAGEAAVAAATARHNDLSLMMTELVLRGIAHRCPLTVTEIS